MKKINTKKLLLRIITLPFFGVIALITMIYNYSVWIWRWLLYGGEIIGFNENENKSIKDIYELLKEILEANQDEKQNK